MQFKDGANVLTAEGDKVGELDRVVLDPHDREVTHVVVRKGFFFKTDKVVPISLIGTAEDGEIRLREDAGDLSALPEFIETQYIPIDQAEVSEDLAPDDAAPIYWYPPVGPAWWGAGLPGMYGYPVPPYVIEAEKHVPEGTVALKEGAKVLDVDQRHVGEVEAVLTDAEQDRATHLLISKGLILKESKLVPTLWIAEVREDEIRLLVGSNVIEGLPAYEPTE